MKNLDLHAGVSVPRPPRSRGEVFPGRIVAMADAKRTPTVKETLQKLLILHHRSLPAYLRFARPYTQPGDEQAFEVLVDIAADQQRIVERIAAMLDEADESVDWGEFPEHFTDLHDLSLDFLLREVADQQRKTILAIEQCAEALRDAPAARDLALEALGMAKGHLDNLHELHAQHVMPST